jgi:hypothetical protein
MTFSIRNEPEYDVNLMPSGFKELTFLNMLNTIERGSDLKAGGEYLDYLIKVADCSIGVSSKCARKADFNKIWVLYKAKNQKFLVLEFRAGYRNDKFTISKPKWVFSWTKAMREDTWETPKMFYDQDKGLLTIWEMNMSGERTLDINLVCINPRLKRVMFSRCWKNKDKFTCFLLDEDPEANSTQFKELGLKFSNIPMAKAHKDLLNESFTKGWEQVSKKKVYSFDCVNITELRIALNPQLMCFKHLFNIYLNIK